MPTREEQSRRISEELKARGKTFAEILAEATCPVVDCYEPGCNADCIT